MQSEAGRKTHWRWNVWFVWNYSRYEQHLNRLSEQGLHLSRPGMVLGRFEKDIDKRFIYQVDYRPGLRKSGTLAEYFGLLQDAGWEYLGSRKAWCYFRCPCSLGSSVTPLYTDRESVKHLYRRIRLPIGIILLLEIMIGIVDGKLFSASKIGGYSWYLLGPMVALDVLLAYGWMRLTLAERKV